MMKIIVTLVLIIIVNTSFTQTLRFRSCNYFDNNLKNYSIEDKNYRLNTVIGGDYTIMGDNIDIITFLEVYDKKDSILSKSIVYQQKFKRSGDLDIPEIIQNPNSKQIFLVIEKLINNKVTYSLNEISKDYSIINIRDFDIPCYEYYDIENMKRKVSTNTTFLNENTIKLSYKAKYSSIVENEKGIDLKIVLLTIYNYKTNNIFSKMIKDDRLSIEDAVVQYRGADDYNLSFSCSNLSKKGKKIDASVYSYNFKLDQNANKEFKPVKIFEIDSLKRRSYIKLSSDTISSDKNTRIVATVFKYTYELNGDYHFEIFDNQYFKINDSNEVVQKYIIDKNYSKFFNIKEDEFNNISIYCLAAADEKEKERWGELYISNNGKIIFTKKTEIAPVKKSKKE